MPVLLCGQRTESCEFDSALEKRVLGCDFQARRNFVKRWLRGANALKLMPYQRSLVKNCSRRQSRHGGNSTQTVSCTVNNCPLQVLYAVVGFFKCCMHAVGGFFACSGCVFQVLHAVGGFFKCCMQWVGFSSAACSGWIFQVLHAVGGFFKCCMQWVGFHAVGAVASACRITLPFNGIGLSTQRNLELNMKMVKNYLTAEEWNQMVILSPRKSTPLFAARRRVDGF